MGVHTIQSPAVIHQMIATQYYYINEVVHLKEGAYPGPEWGLNQLLQHSCYHVHEKQTKETLCSSLTFFKRKFKNSKDNAEKKVVDICKMKQLYIFNHWSYLICKFEQTFETYNSCVFKPQPEKKHFDQYGIESQFID